MAEYLSKIGSCSIGGVNRQGEAHPVLKFEDGVPLSIPDDEGQTYDQTLKHVLDAGHIQLVVPKPAKKE